jgi:hypothetical protein
MFKMTISDIQTTNDDMLLAINKTSGIAYAINKTNTSFLDATLGAFSTAANSTNIMIENNLQILVEAAEGVQHTYSLVLSDARDKLVVKRNEVCEAVGGGSPGDDMLYYDDAYANLANRCGYAETDYNDFETAINSTIEAADGLDNAGAILAPLQNLLSVIPGQVTTIGNLATAYIGYKDAVESFESTYTGKFSVDEFVTDEMIDQASEDLASRYKGTQAQDVKDFLSTAKDELKYSVKYPYELMSGMLQQTAKAWGVVADYWKPSKGAAAFLDTFADKYTGKLTDVFNPKSWAKDVDVILDEGDDMLKAVGGNADDCLASTSNVAKGLSTAAEKFSHVAKFAGKVCDVIDIASIGIDSYKAYETTAGDAYDKQGAAEVTAAYGTTKFITKKAVTTVATIVGTAFGGPLGGAIAGVVSDVAFGLIWDNFIATDDKVQQASENRANELREKATGSSQRQFAAGGAF